MKRKLYEAVTLLMALALLSGLALSEGITEEPETGLEIGEEAILAEAAEEQPEELEIELTGEEEEKKTEATYRFVVDETEYANQVARAGEEILRPEDPEAPEGKIFAGWTLVDGTPLFVDADGDGEIDPVIIGENEVGTEVYVWAEFADAGEETFEEKAVEEEQSAEKEPSEEVYVEEAPAEEQPVEEVSVEEAPAEEQSVEAQPAATEPSPMGKVAQPEAETDEVLVDTASASDETEAEPSTKEDDVAPDTEPAAEETSSVTADAVKQGASQPDHAENSPQESFPGAAVSPEGKAFGDEEATAKEALAEEAPVEEAAVEVEPVEAQPAATEPSPMGKVAQPEAETDEVLADTASASDETEAEPNTKEDDVTADAEPAAEQPSPAPVPPIANELIYTGEAQALVTGEGWLYSLDGESYGEALPAAVNAGEYTVYFKAAESDAPQTIAVTVAKADVVFTAPVAAVG